jgi:threonine/homoserine/homoserine lactone efflux protein
MPDKAHLSLFFAAAFRLAITPGPGIFYVLARSLAGGRKEGSISSLGTFVGGLIHVLAAALGISAILAASAIAFSIVKYAGAAYLIYLGIRTIQTRKLKITADASLRPARDSFKQGVWTEVLNPKTALFFLAFIPQFVSPTRGHVFLQFAVLGSLSVIMNTSADPTVAAFAGLISDQLRANPRLQSRQRVVSGFGMIGLGVYVGCSGTPHSK